MHEGQTSVCKGLCSKQFLVVLGVFTEAWNCNLFDCYYPQPRVLVFFNLTAFTDVLFFFYYCYKYTQHIVIKAWLIPINFPDSLNFQPNFPLHCVCYIYALWERRALVLLAIDFPQPSPLVGLRIHQSPFIDAITQGTLRRAWSPFYFLAEAAVVA